MIADAAFLDKAHARCSRHRGELEASETCACFYCCETFAPSQISEWIEDHWKDGAPMEPADNWTAICPHCGIDSVVGSASGLPVNDPTFLQAMHDYWFERKIDASN
jgi:hypothetical protein